MCLLPFFTIITYNRGVDIKLRDLITDYIRNNPAIKAAARRDSGIIKADSLDFYPLSRAVKLIAAKRGGRLFAISPTDESARQLFQDLLPLRNILRAYEPNTRNPVLTRDMV